MTGAVGAGGAARPRWRTVLRLVPVVLLGVVVWREKPWAVSLSPSAPWAVVASILLNLSVFLPLKAARWRVALVEPPPFRQALAATLEGLLANAALGFGSGDVVRAARLGRGRFAADYGCTWAERGAEALALAILVFVAALLTDLGVVALASSGLVAAGYFAVILGGRSLVPRLGRWPRIQNAVAAGIEASTPRRVAVMATLSLLGWGSELGMLVLFQHAFALEPSFRTALVTLVGLNAAIAIPAVPGNFGTFEAGVTTALVLCGAPRDVAVLYAVTYHLSHVIPVAIIATGVYLARSRSGARGYGTRRYRATPAGSSASR